MNKPLTLAIVIPVYNEERYLKACLDSIAAQTVKPDEVIVVNNNSTDKSLEIAGRFRFVKILHEKRQHQVFAQSTGFNAAKSDILARIDGDSILPKDWVDRVKTAFADRKVAAVTGGADPYDVSLKWFGTALFRAYLYLAGVIAGTRLIWGANCAIRRSAWHQIKQKVLMRSDIWEDYDLAFCLKTLGTVRYIPNIKMGVSARVFHTSLSKQISYQFRAVRTFYLRSGYPRTAIFALLWSTTLFFYPFAVLDKWLLQLRKSQPKALK